MDRKIALKWARALESDEYPQTDGTLRSVNGFCCLGVLCNLHAMAHPQLAVQEEFPDMYLGEDTLLPSEVMTWAGIHESDGTFQGFTVPHPTIGDNNASSLVELNDNFKFDFHQIAKVIRKHSEQL